MARIYDPLQLSLWETAPAPELACRRLPMPGAEVLYYPAFLGAKEAQVLFEELRAIAPWQADRRRMYDRTVDVPRLISWYGEYGPSDSLLATRDWPELLLPVRQRVEEVSGHHFRAVLLNLYRDGRDSVAWHSDEDGKPVHGVSTASAEPPMIASLTLGATRRFMFRPRPGRPGSPLNFELPAGSLLLMGPGSQAHWEHCVPKTLRPVGERLNLTFRLSLRS